jgi:sugar phosphate isomerase/epimerase
MNRWPLIAMENTLFADRSLGWPERCATIAAAGFDGVYAAPYPLTDDDLPRLRQLDYEPRQLGLRLTGIYINFDLAQPAGSESNRRVGKVFREVEGVPRIELSFKCSDLNRMPLDLDDAIRAQLETLLTIADQRGVDVALYPHSFYPLETPAHAARIVSEINHPRLSYLFATSHVYAVSEPAEVVSQLAACVSEISSFNVCGCRRVAPGLRAKCAHFPLDESDLPLLPVFETLATGGYQGEVMVQGHGWQGNLPGLLKRCVSAYEQILKCNTEIVAHTKS